MGLDLGSGQGLLGTAISRVAHQTDVEASAGVPTQVPSRFGQGMPIIDPGRPDNSYLVYKLVINRASFGPDPCGASAYSVALAGVCLPASAAETDRLRDWFVRGEPMPPPETGFSLVAEDVRLVERWILDGAPTTDCQVAAESG